MRKVLLNPSMSRLMIVLPALALGLVFALLLVRFTTPQVSAATIENTNLVVQRNILGAHEINVTPTIARNRVGESHTITATVTATGAQTVSGIEVDFRIIAGPHSGASASDVTDANGMATFTYTGDKAGTDTIAACISDGSSNRACDLAAKRWVATPRTSLLRLTPARDTNPVGTNHTLTATVSSTGSQPVVGVLVGFRVVSGPTVGVTGSDTTDANGLATFTYQGVAVGVDVIRACVDGGDSRRTCDRAVKKWTSDDAPPGGQNSCQGENSCRGRDISVGDNSCNRDNSCNGNNITVGDNSCNEEKSCRGNNSDIANNSCNGEEACRGNQMDVGNRSCNQEKACRGNTQTVGSSSCNGEESCRGNENLIGDNSCNGEESCKVSNSTIPDNSCNEEAQCSKKGEKPNNQRSDEEDGDGEEEEDADEEDGDNSQANGRGRGQNDKSDSDKGRQKGRGNGEAKSKDDKEKGGKGKG